MSAKAIIVLDWIGWMLMMTTLWSWIYRSISPKLTQHLLASKHRFQVLERSFG